MEIFLFLATDFAKGFDHEGREGHEEKQPQRTRRSQREKSLSGKQGIRMWISGYQSIRLPDIRGRGISKIVHAPNLKNKIGAGSALILSLRNSGENPTRRVGPLRRGRIAARATARQERFNVKRTRKRDSINNERYFALRFLRKAKLPKPSSKSVDGSGTSRTACDGTSM